MDDKRLLGAVRKTVEEYSLIEEGDKICVGVSGGKDSLSLLYALSKLKLFLPRKFDLSAVNVDLGFENTDPEKQELIREYAKSLSVPYTSVKTDIARIVFDEREEKSPCSLCANMRRGALNKTAKSLGCNKVALAHSMDDFIETLVLSLVYEGRISTMPIKSYLTNSGITVIRPLFYADEQTVISFSKDLPIMKNPCPVDKHTKRQYAKELVKRIDAETQGGRDRMRSACIELVRKNNLEDKE